MLTTTGGGSNQPQPPHHPPSAAALTGTTPLTAPLAATSSQSQQQQNSAFFPHHATTTSTTSALNDGVGDGVEGGSVAEVQQQQHQLIPTTVYPSASQSSIGGVSAATGNFLSSKDDEWHHGATAGSISSSSTPAASTTPSKVCAYHDCASLAVAWNLGPPTTSLDATRFPTGASQAHSPSLDDAGDGRSNELLSSCPAFRNEIGTDIVRRVGLSRRTTRAPTASSSISAAPLTLADSTTPLNNNNDIATASMEPSMSRVDEPSSYQRENTASEVGVLEDVSNVYLGGRLCAMRQPAFVIEPQGMGSYYYRHCFAGRAHSNFFGMDEQYGPIAVSMMKEISDRKESNGTITNTSLYRLIIRVADLFTMRVTVPEESMHPESMQDSKEKSARTVIRELLDLTCPHIHFGSIRQAMASPKVEELLTKVDEQPIYARYKVGVLYCRAGQSTEEQMYNNEHSSPAFEEFLEFLGTRVRLKGFDGYKGGLDTRGDTTGVASFYTEYHSHEIMFHVSTMLPFTPNNRQQLSRKRHIGNDMVTIIFQEPGALPFCPITVRSHFQHVFIVVRVNHPCTEQVNYTVAVARAKDVPSFGPPIPPGSTYQKCTEFHEFLLTKIINAENAVHRSKKFAAMAARTRKEALRDLAENYVVPHANEGPSRIASRFLGGSMKQRKERFPPRLILDSSVRGALSWKVEVHDFTFGQWVSCVMGISAETLVLLEVPLGASIFATPIHSILGWANTETGLKLFYDHGDMLLIRLAEGCDERELNQILRRLAAVTNGDEAKEVILRKNKANDSFGFRMQEEGIVTDVDMYQTAWKVGVRQGSRIVEIENTLLATMSFEQVRAVLVERTQLKVRVINPCADGNPRRGCEDPNCSAIKEECPAVQQMTPDTFARQPLSYQQEMIRLRQLQKDSNSGPSSTNSSFDAPTFGQRLFRSQQQLNSIATQQFSPSSTISSSIQLARDRKKNSAPILEPLITERLLPRLRQNLPALGQDEQQQNREAGSGNNKQDLLNRAQSDDPLFGGRSESLGTPGVGTPGSAKPIISLRNDESPSLDEFLRQRERTAELEAQNRDLWNQLNQEKQAHEVTKRQLEVLQEYCERYFILPSQFDNDNDEEL